MLCCFSGTSAKLCPLRLVYPSIKAFDGFGLGFKWGQRYFSLRQVFCREAQRLNLFGQCDLCRDVAFFLGNRHLALEDAKLLAGLVNNLGFVFGFLAGFVDLVVLFAKRNLLVQTPCVLGFLAQHVKLVTQSTGLLSIVNKLFFLGRRYVLCLHRLKAGDSLLNARSLLHCLQLKRDLFLLVVFRFLAVNFFLLLFQLVADASRFLVVRNYLFIVV